MTINYRCRNGECAALYSGEPPEWTSLVRVRYHVALDGAAGPDVELLDPPLPRETLEAGGATMVVYDVVEGADGSLVINASRAREGDGP